MKVIALVALFLVTNAHAAPSPAWSERKAYFMAKLTGDPQWEKRWWIEKTVRTLRGGKGFNPGEKSDDYLALPEDQIIDKLMNDPQMGNMVLDFNMYFLGFKMDTLWQNGTYTPFVFDYPSAVDSARQVMAGGDYFNLFDLQIPMYFGHPRVQKRSEDREKGRTDYEVVQNRIAHFTSTFRQYIDLVKTDTTSTVAQLCDRYTVDIEDGLRQDIFDMGIPDLFAFDVMLKWGAPFRQTCRGKDPTKEKLATELEKIAHMADEFFIDFLNLAKPDYMPQNVDQIRVLDFSSLGMSKTWSQYGVIRRVSLPNSSTNYNRKRSAYVLKHFFCDDLTPIGVEDPKQHTGGPHGSETSCFACHYKLDPMGGFFRNIGAFFNDFSNSKEIYFDDQAHTDRVQYTQAWLAPKGSSRTWNVGYVRSINDESMNDYGETLEDLHKLFRTAPEVKRCVVKRLFEYIVSDEQTIDGGYLDYLSKELTTRSKTNSSQAFKWVVSQLLQSKSFHQPDLDPGQCYDYRPGYSPKDSPPCRVAFILQKNCVGCHSQYSPPNGLYLGGWTQLSDGSYNFPHTDAQGNQLPVKYTMDKIIYRLSAPDEKERMPLGMHMSSQDRQELFLWAQEMLAK